LKSPCHGHYLASAVKLSRLRGAHNSRWRGSTADRLTGRGADSFGYDPLDRLTSSTVASTSRTYTYSATGCCKAAPRHGDELPVDLAITPSRVLAQGGDRIVYGLGPLYIIKVDGTTRHLRATAARVSARRSAAPARSQDRSSRFRGASNTR
jgi:hypothetical protein